MADRRAKFEKKFRNVWSTGATGVSYLQMTVNNDPVDLINRLFKSTMIADEWDILTGVKRSYVNHGHETIEDRSHHLTFVTSDDRVAEVIEEVAAWSADHDKRDIPFDLIVTPLATGSKEYIEWVKLQSLKKDDSTAFFNEKAQPAMKALTKTVAEKEAESTAVDVTAVQTGQSLWNGGPEDDEDDE